MPQRYTAATLNFGRSARLPAASGLCDNHPVADVTLAKPVPCSSARPGVHRQLERLQLLAQYARRVAGQKRNERANRVAKVHVHINARLQPKHRDKRFEGPLSEILARLAPGSEIVGGGTLLSAEREPLSCDIEFFWAGEPERATAAIVDMLEQNGIPRGSYVSVNGGTQRDIGMFEGVGVYLNGTDLPDQVYAESDVNELITHSHAALGGRGELYSWWKGPRETALYFYGPSAATVRELLGPVLDSDPLAQRCRVVDLT